MKKTFDFAIIGSGVFGAWTAKYLRDSGASVALLDAYGAGNSRSSSGGESRIIRNGYGRDELYTRWAMQSFPLWQELCARTGRTLFHRTGVLWLSNQADPHVRGMAELLKSMQAKCEELDAQEIRRRYPQLVFDFDDVTLGVLEPESGMLMARQAVQALVKLLGNEGVDCRTAAVLPPGDAGRLAEVKTSDGSSLSAGTFIFACGSWLPKLFPELLRGRIFPTRQEVFFLGAPAGSDDFRAPKMPAWLHHTHPDRPYAVPDLEHRGFKMAWDRHGPEFDPDRDMRVVPAASVDHLRTYLKQHIPALQDAPIIEARVCHYENTWNGDFLIDRHPGFENVWLAGGGSGHGFKHGPAVGEYLSARLLRSAPAEPRFSLSSKQARQERAVY
jgi:glycine/D-amino acid oxidase-like deaminating enzyme